MAVETRYITLRADDLAAALALAQTAQNAAQGDSNDAEIDALREALEAALALVGAALPEPNGEWAI